MIDWTNVLLDTGIDIPLDSPEFNIACPFHADTQPSLSMNIDKGLWICHVGCGQGSLEYFLGKYLHLNKEEVATYLLQQYNNFDINIFDSPEIEEEVLPEVSFPYESGWVPEWIFDREFTKATLNKWECATDEDSNLVIPIRTPDQLIRGWVSRRLYLTPKYLYSKGLKCSRILFGENHLQPSPFVCITEGTLDTMWLDQNGFPSVAIFGASLSKQQEDLLLRLPTKELVLCLDRDEAGQKATDNILTRLNNRCIISNITIPKEYKDVQDIRNSDEIADVLNNRKLW